MARWTSRHASLVTTVYGLGGIDGFNEAGLAGHGLYLKSTDFGPRDATIHVALEDVSGAIIEFDHGSVVVHHGRQFTLMTNDPTYDEQLKLLAEQDYSHPDRDMPLPGNVNAVDRFQRAACYSALLPAPNTERELTTSPNTIWVQFDKLGLADATRPLAVDPCDDSMVGNVTSRFTPHQSRF